MNTKSNTETAFEIFYSKIKERRILWEEKQDSKEGLIVWSVLSEVESVARQTLMKIRND